MEISNLNNIFDINSVNSNFVDQDSIILTYRRIEKSFSFNELSKYGLIGFYKIKKNAFLILITNKRIFIAFINTNKTKNILPSESFSFDDIYSIKFNNRKINQNAIITFDDDTEIKINGIKENDIKKINDFIIEGKHNLNLEFLKNNNIKSKNELLENNFLNINENEYDQNVIKKNRVVNDLVLSNTTSFSSLLIYNLLTNPLQKFPNGETSLANDIISRIAYLEKTNIFNFDLDSIALKFSSNLKLNTVPIVAEFSSLDNSKNLETRFLFTKNWIEYTKHNVQNKILGVDSTGNGAYIDMNKYVLDKCIDYFKSKEYKINDEIRYGLRSGQTISFLEKNQKIGIDSLYFNSITNEKLNVIKYDGIIFKGIKYYFNIPNEFSKLQKRYCRIFVQDKKNNDDLIKSYELIFEDDLISYKVFNERGILIDDLHNHSSINDLKWLTFFKD